LPISGCGIPVDLPDILPGALDYQQRRTPVRSLSPTQSPSDPCGNTHLTGYMFPRQPAQHRLSPVTVTLRERFMAWPRRPPAGHCNEIAVKVAPHASGRGVVPFVFRLFSQDAGVICP